MLSCLGKIIIVLSLCFQAYVLFENQTVAKQFNQNLLEALTSCKCIPDHIAGHILAFGRFAVVGLLASSAFMLLMKCWLFQVLVILGLSTLLYIEHQPFTKVPCIGCISLWEKISVIGGLIYLMGADCGAGSCQKVSAPEKSQKSLPKAPKKAHRQ